MSTLLLASLTLKYPLIPFLPQGFLPLLCRTSDFETPSFRLDLYPSEIHEKYSDGISSLTIVDERRLIYGPGLIEVPIPSLLKLIASEVFHPLYALQLVAIGIWLWDEYYQYAGAIIVITVVFLCVEIYETRLVLPEV